MRVWVVLRIQSALANWVSYRIFFRGGGGGGGGGEGEG